MRKEPVQVTGGFPPPFIQRAALASHYRRLSLSSSCSTSDPQTTITTTSAAIHLTSPSPSPHASALPPALPSLSTSPSHSPPSPTAPPPPPHASSSPSLLPSSSGLNLTDTYRQNPSFVHLWSWRPTASSGVCQEYDVGLPSPSAVCSFTTARNRAARRHGGLSIDRSGQSDLETEV